MVLNVVAVFIKCNVASFTWISTIHVNTFITPFFQAQARCHRIGQTKEVKVYRLITRNSYEREMFDKASLKLGLDKAVLQSMGSDKNAPVSCYRLCQSLWKCFYHDERSSQLRQKLKRFMSADLGETDVEFTCIFLSEYLLYYIFWTFDRK